MLRITSVVNGSTAVADACRTPARGWSTASLSVAPLANWLVLGVSLTPGFYLRAHAVFAPRLPFRLIQPTASFNPATGRLRPPPRRGRSGSPLMSPRQASDV